MRLNELKPQDVQSLRALVVDVDGVLTRGDVTYTATGDEIKSFHVRDGSALKYWHRVGHISAFLTGRSSPVVLRRAEELGVGHVVQQAKNKLPGLEEIAAKLQVTPQECIYVGDDLPDIPVLRTVGLGIAVADAMQDVKDVARAVTERSGGCGAVCEVIETVLRLQGRWNRILSRYLPELAAEADRMPPAGA